MTARALASVAAFVLFAAACGGSEPTDSPTPEQNGSTPVDSVTTDHHETGSAPPVRATVAPRIDGLDGAPVPALQVESSEFDEDRFNAGGGRFPPLNDPAIVSAAEADWLTGDSLVLGAIQNGEARAYPVGMMTFHHVSNDVLGGEPYLVTF